MVQNLHITISDDVFNDIIERMKVENKSNRSEYVGWLIRVGLRLTESKKKGDMHETS